MSSRLCTLSYCGLEGSAELAESVAAIRDHLGFGELELARTIARAVEEAVLALRTVGRLHKGDSAIELVGSRAADNELVAAGHEVRKCLLLSVVHFCVPFLCVFVCRFCHVAVEDWLPLVGVEPPPPVLETGVRPPH